MLDGYRILVVGASTGIGRAVGIQSAQAGAAVAFAARRTELLEDAVDAAGGSSFAVACDVRREEQCAGAVEEAVERFGGLDAVVYAAGKSPLVRFADADGDTWRDVMETNVVGAALVSRAALPHLEASSGRLLLLGSSGIVRPLPGLIAYTTSKAAVHQFARSLRNENPWLRVTNFVVGPTITEFSAGWDPDLAGPSPLGRRGLHVVLTTHDRRGHGRPGRPGAGQRRTDRRGPRDAGPVAGRS